MGKLPIEVIITCPVCNSTKYTLIETKKVIVNDSKYGCDGVTRILKINVCDRCGILFEGRGHEG